MPAYRYYVDRDLTVDQKIALQDEEFHHLVHVMRAKVDSQIEVVNGKGSLAIAKVLEIQRKEVFLKIVSTHQIKEAKFSLILAQGIPKAPRLELILEKGTELGMTEIWLFPADYSEKKLFNE